MRRRLLSLGLGLLMAGCQTSAAPPAPAAVATPAPLTADYTPGGKLNGLAQETKEWDNHWNGVPLLQYPNDLMVYQNLIYETHPDAIVEVGTYYGGLTLYLATILEGLDDPAPIITIDIEDKRWNELLGAIKAGKMRIKKSLLDRVVFVHGGSTDPKVVARVQTLLKGKKNPLIILDSLHEYDHVLSECRLYSKMVPVGGLLVVTDTQLDGTDLLQGTKGPLAAARDFLKENKDFAVQVPAKQYMVSALHEGILKRLK